MFFRKEPTTFEKWTFFGCPKWKNVLPMEEFLKIFLLE
jgi:hypothetical protein